MISGRKLGHRSRRIMPENAARKDVVQVRLGNVEAFFAPLLPQFHKGLDRMLAPNDEVLSACKGRTRTKMRAAARIFLSYQCRRLQ